MQCVAAEPQDIFVHPDVPPLFPLVLVLVMLHEPWLTYRWILGMEAWADMGSWLVCSEDEEICHYPLQAIPLMLPGT